MKNLIFLVILSFLMPNCHKKTIPSVSPMNSSTNTNLTNITYLALGDSYTIGESVAESERYPNQLAEALKEKGFFVSSLKNIARTGWTTDELRKGIDAENIENNKYDMVSLLIGVNNQYRNRPVEQYKTEFTNLLNDAIRYANGNKKRVFVVSIPDYAYTPFGGGREAISKGIDEYNAANRQITESAGILYINITPISREGLKDPSLVAVDKLHPSAKQYSQWTSLMLPEVEKLLK
jgi:lysophospholipase L1-like esterase